MFGAWRVHKHKLNKQVIHLTISKEAYSCLNKLCRNWQKGPTEVIENLLRNAKNLSELAHKEEKRVFNEKKQVLEEKYQKKASRLLDKRSSQASNNQPL